MDRNGTQISKRPGGCYVTVQSASTASPAGERIMEGLLSF